VINLGAPNAIPGQYIVVFQPAVAHTEVLAAERSIRALGGTIEFRYTSALVGFSVKAPASALEALRALAGVEWIEVDQAVSLDTEQLNPPRGLDRTSERLLQLFPKPPLDGRYTYSETGAGVHVYVIDTGILFTHTDFGGRAIPPAFDAFGGTGLDCNGHGTHVAGTIGGTTYGIAKQVRLHAVRVLDCSGTGSWSGVIAGVDWVTSNAIHPAVANMSLGGGASPAVDAAVTNSIASGVTYVVAAGNSGANACNYSPARVPSAITVGATDPTNDNAAVFSNVGPCLDLFAPGVQIASAWPDGIPKPVGSDCVVVSTTPGAGAMSCSGTSMAAPHVAGVAAFYLEEHPSALPASVWGGFHGIHYNNDVPTTPDWPGIVNPGPGSPNELLHWGSLNDGFDDGDPHLTTVDGVHYDFQSAGEFVLLRDGGGLEIQTRQTPIATTFNPGPNPHTGLATCVSVNTAVAARVGEHRVTFQPNLSGVPDPSGLQLRVDGVLTPLGANELDLGPGARVVPSPGGGIAIDFPDGTGLVATPGWWASQGKWYLNVSVFHTPASEGILGAMAPGSWLPALPDGTSLGPLPASLHQRHLDLNQTFAEAWRVTDETSLFDYARGASTATFTLRSWPPESPPCLIPEASPAKPLDLRTARRLCRPIADRNLRADCVFDVRVTGERGFAITHALTHRIREGSTTVSVSDDRDPTPVGEPVTFTATVAPTAAGAEGVPVGTVQFVLDGSRVGRPIRLDSNGRAAWTTSSLAAGDHRVAASYIPRRRSGFLAGSSRAEAHAVKRSDELDCATTVVVSGMHYPDRTCAQSSSQFRDGLLTNFHLTSKCPLDTPLTSVFDIACQNAPIPGFSSGSVYTATACCGNAAPPVAISNLPMQGGDERTPCPALAVTYKRSDGASVPYLGIMLPGLDQQCAAKGPGLRVATVKFLRCAPDPRGKGFGPNASADITCAK
jgi:hypothetical protein